MDRPKNGSFVTTHPKYGTVYSVADAKEMFDLVRREGGFMYQTHPRAKGSTGFLDQILATDYFRDPSYLGTNGRSCLRICRRRGSAIARSTSPTS